MKQSDDNKFIPMTSVSAGSGKEVAADVYYYTNQIVNVVMVGNPGADWVLIDAGMPKSGAKLLEVAEERFGKGNKPKAILLTHGHFDHVGGITHLLEHWQVPVFAHPLEFPFLNGSMDYSEPDPTVEGGMLAKISAYYPNEATDISEFLQELPQGGEVPFLDDWQWLETPGHSPGHVSFFRESDRLLLSGDAVVTVRQDSFYNVLLQPEEVNGPPRYLTTDWNQARQSVKTLADLSPEVLVAGHGQFMSGETLREELRKLAAEFDTRAKPAHGKYVDE